MTKPSTEHRDGPVIRRRPTRAQGRVLRAIGELTDELGHSPSLREVADRVQTGVSTVHHHVTILEAGGWLDRRPKCPRTLVLRTEVEHPVPS